MSTFRQKVQAKSDWGKPDPEEEAPVQGRKAEKKAAKNAGRKPRRRAAPAPVTSHRLFPAFAALWLAALFGLGSLAISSDVLGRLVTALGLPALVPAAAPPLGFTAHLLVALALTAVGAGLGLLVGLRLRPQTATQDSSFAAPAPVAAEPLDTGVPKVRARDAHPDAPPRRPLVLTEAFADQAEPAIVDTDAPAEPLLRQKPSQTRDFTPDEGPVPAPALAETATWIPEYTPGGIGAIEPLDLAALDIASIDAEFAAESAAALFASPAAEAEPEPAELDIAEPEIEAQDEPAAEATPETVVPEAAPPEPVLPEPVWEAPRPTLLAATPQIPSGTALTLPDPAKLQAGETWSPVAGAPLENLGLVQLIERLALAIAAHKTAGDAGPPQPSLTPPADGLVPEDDLAAERVVEAAPVVEMQIGADSETDAAHEPEADLDLPSVDPSAPFARPIERITADSDVPAVSARDAILHRLGAVQALGPVTTGPGPFSRPPEVAANPEAQADAVVPLRQPERQEEAADPAAVLAAAPAPLPAETDEALRSALATLQRMSARG